MMQDDQRWNVKCTRAAGGGMMLMACICFSHHRSPGKPAIMTGMPSTTTSGYRRLQDSVIGEPHAILSTNLLEGHQLLFKRLTIG